MVLLAASASSLERGARPTALGAQASPPAPRPTAPAAATAAIPARAVADSARSAGLARADLARIKGREQAAVWVVVMSDFQCPYCKVWHEETAPLIERDYVATGKVRLAYLNYIAVQSHRNAPPAHEAAMCAAEQGRFWPMADALFASQKEWSDRRDAGTYFEALALKLRLELPRFRACVRDQSMRPMIDADQDRVVRLGMSGTPAFLIGGTRIIGAQPYSAFRKAIDEALARAVARPR